MPDTGEREGKSQEIIRPDAEAKPKFLRSSLRDPAFYAQHEAAILAAAREGRIIDDVSDKKLRMGQPFGKVSK